LEREKEKERERTEMKEGKREWRRGKGKSVQFIEARDLCYGSRDRSIQRVPSQRSSGGRMRRWRRRGSRRWRSRRGGRTGAGIR